MYKSVAENHDSTSFSSPYIISNTGLWCANPITMSLTAASTSFFSNILNVYFFYFSLKSFERSLMLLMFIRLNAQFLLINYNNEIKYLNCWILYYRNSITIKIRYSFFYNSIAFKIHYKNNIE